MLIKGLDSIPNEFTVLKKLLLMPLLFKRNKVGTVMESVETADKRQPDRCKVMGAGKE